MGDNMERTYDVVVIGTGPAGGTIAPFCAQQGLKTAVVDVRSSYGGVCPLRGCNPKKVLVDVSGVVRSLQNLRGKGLSGGIEVDWQELMRFKRTFTEPVPEAVIDSYKKKGIDTYFGRASFEKDHSLRVGDHVLRAETFAVASGSVPNPLGIPGEDLLITSAEFLELETLPEELLFVGGGYIACEFACVAALSGSKATLVIRSERALREFDLDLVRLLMRSMSDIGIEVLYNMPIKAVEQNGGAFVFRGGKEGKDTLRAQGIVHAAGRVPDVADLGLERIGVTASSRGIAVDGYMQSVSNPRVYAAGDVAAAGYMLTPSASLGGEVAAHNMVNGKSTQVDFTGIPSVCFTSPPLARVGMCEEEVRDKGISYQRRYKETGSTFSSRKIGEKHSGYKLLTEEGSGRILGAHLLGHNADEVINVFALAMRLGLTVDELRKAVWAYPTYIYDIGHMLP